MKVCPQCAFANEERFPACLWCNELLVNVRSTPAADPNHPEHAQSKLDAERHARLHHQWMFAALVYCLAATGMAVLPGMMHDPVRLLLHFGAAAIVAVAVGTRLAGQHSGMFLHGALSTALVYFFGPMHVFIFSCSWAISCCQTCSGTGPISSKAHTVDRAVYGGRLLG